MYKRHRIWLESYLKNCEKLNRSQHTINNYRADLQKYLAFYEYKFARHINKANAKSIEAYKDYLSGQMSPERNWRARIWFRKVIDPPPMVKLGVNSQKRHLSTIKNFYDYLIQTHEDTSKLFDKNPVKSKIHTIKVKDADINHTKLLNHRDWDVLEKRLIKTKDRLIASLLYYGGLRLEELTRLEYKDFSSRTQSVNFIRKGGERHFLKIREFETIYDLLEMHQSIEGHGSHERLFPVSKRALYGYIKRMFQKAGLSKELTPHSFRKACATNLYIETKDILQVRNYLNHKDAKVTQTYIEY